MGFGIVISLAIISELIVEITYPVGECLSIGKTLAIKCNKNYS